MGQQKVCACDRDKQGETYVYPGDTVECVEPDEKKQLKRGHRYKVLRTLGDLFQTHLELDGFKDRIDGRFFVTRFKLISHKQNKENKTMKDPILKIDIHTYGNLIFGKVLLQDTSVVVRGKFSYSAEINGVKYWIRSSSGGPNCGKNGFSEPVLVCLGEEINYDNRAFLQQCDNEEQAQTWKAAFEELLERINNSETKPTVVVLEKASIK